MEWTLSTSENPPSIYLGEQLVVRRTAGGGWEVGHDGQWRSLREPRDYWRVVILLEKPMPEVVAAVGKFGDDFPYVNVVYSGLLMSQNWARLAVGWIPLLPAADQGMLVPTLADIEKTSAFDQNLRRTARQMRKLIERAAGMTEIR
ncbi:hypothetical protein ACFSOZ_15350 [Mesorhizobium newzealandense]|uniref:Uncharacterized protein n=1 Tax=Mesorhizobium newzealandense TaxID=1300302 RepID=A0ABW4UAD8_9HYPH